MNTRWRILLLALPLLLLGSEVDAAAQVGRLMGNVAYYGRDRRAYIARGVRVIAVGNYVQSETRTDAYGNFALLLRPGGYKVYAQGGYGFAAGESTGYVRAGANSYISPNPILLAQQAAGNWDGMASLALGTVFSGVEGETAPPLNSMTPVVTVPDADLGKLYGRITIRNTNCNDELTKNRRVVILGAYVNTEVQTGHCGYFKSLPLRAGLYEIRIIAEGFQQESRVVGTVRPGEDSQVSPNPIWLSPVRMNSPPRNGRGE